MDFPKRSLRKSWRSCYVAAHQDPGIVGKSSYTGFTNCNDPSNVANENWPPNVDWASVNRNERLPIPKLMMSARKEEKNHCPFVWSIDKEKSWVKREIESRDRVQPLLYSSRHNPDPSNSTLLVILSSTDSNGAGDPTQLTGTNPEDISSLFELTAFVTVSLAVDARFLKIDIPRSHPQSLPPKSNAFMTPWFLLQIWIIRWHSQQPLTFVSMAR
jgi:hypothetical protein